VKENAFDRTAHGTIIKGEMHPNAIFTEPQVSAIKAELLQGKTMYSIAKKLGVSQGAIRKIRYGQTWGWVDPQI
jgi:DNA-binding NarL/FixJ family response regulator